LNQIYPASIQAGIHLDYSTQLFQRKTIESLMLHLRTLAEQILENPQVSLAEVEIISKDEKEHLLVDFNNTEASFPRNKTIIGLFEEQVKINPTKIALYTETEEITYEQFAGYVYHLAAQLRVLGIGPGSIVAMISERSVEMLVGIYAILKAGGAYLPIDPTFPAERKALLLKVSNASVVLVQQLNTLPTSFIGNEVLLKRLSEANLNLKNENYCDSQDMAYVLFTSGSTGEPKGVMIPHHAVINRILWMQNKYPISTDDIILQKTPITFDVSVWELFWWAFTGSSLYLLAPGEEKNPQKMIEVIDRAAITVMHFVPSMLNAFLDYTLTLPLNSISGLRRVFTSGEALQPAQVDKFYRCCPTTDLVNLYGPTEATVDVSYFDCIKDCSYVRIPIGKPIQNTSLYILDQFGHPQPLGIPGELHIGGVGLAWGYLNKPDLTASTFVPNPFKKGERLYKTGDLARWLSDGNIEFLGRIDHQVKIRGMRIELGEIEVTLLKMDSISQCVVIAKPIHSSGHQLIAYLILQKNQFITELEIKEYLQTKLPLYMVPAEIIIVEEFPMTSSGKVNTKLLPAPKPKEIIKQQLNLSGDQYEIAQVLVAIWQELLGAKEIDWFDNFFELGGDSILAIQVLSKARLAGIDFTLQQLLQLQNIAALANVATRKEKNNKQVNQETVVGLVPQTPIQRWFFEGILENPHHFNQALLMQLKKPLVFKHVEATLEALSFHHDILRAKFVKKEVWEQIFVDNPYSSLNIYDLSALNEQDQETSLSTLKQKAQSHFDLEKGQLFSVAYFQMGENKRDQMLLVMHHAITDGISWRILLEDFCTVYEQIEQNKSIQLPLKTVSVKSWADFLQKKTDQNEYQLEYWLDKSDSIPIFPIDFDKGLNRVEDSAKERVYLTEEETKEILHISQSFYKADIQDFLLAALAEALDEQFSIQKILVAMEGHGRDYLQGEMDLSRTIGWFTCLYPLVLNYHSGKTKKERIQAVHQQLHDIPNKGIDYGLGRYLGNDSRLASRLEDFSPELCFNYLGQLDQSADHLSLFEPLLEDRGPVEEPKNLRRYLLEVNAYIISHQLHIELTYSVNHFSIATISQLTKLYKDKIKSFISTSNDSLSTLDFPLAQLNKQDLKNLLTQLQIGSKKYDYN